MQEIVKMVDVNHDGKIQFEGMVFNLIGNQWCCCPSKQPITDIASQSFVPLSRLLRTNCSSSLSRSTGIMMAKLAVKS